MIRRTFLLLAGALVLGACGGGDDPAGPSLQSIGTYTLSTVNGQPLPAVLLEDATRKVEILSDVVTLRENGTWSETASLRTTTPTGAVTTTPSNDSGTYSVNGSALVLSSGQSGTTMATLLGSSLTIADAGLVLVYVK
jgi:hypothetical protein